MTKKFLDIEKILYHERYQSELDRRGQINDRIDAQVTLVTGFAAIAAYYVFNFPAVMHARYFILFCAFITLFCIGTVMAGVFVGLAIWNDKTTYLPNPSDTHDDYDLLIRWHIQSDPVNGKAAAEKEIAEVVDEDTYLAADSNAKRNDMRDYFLLWSRRCIFIALAGLILAFPLQLC